jgi:hypothetical protein
MSQLQLKRISKEIIERAKEALIPPKGLPKAVDDYEGTNSALAIAKQREAMGSAGGETQIQLAIATNLLGKRIIMLPSGNGLNLQTFDLNKALETFLKK